MAAIVYLATNQINGKRYIGVTSKGMAARRRQHENSVNTKRSTCRAFHAALRKYGKEAFDWIELLHCETFDAALLEEIRLISEIKPEYNLTVGGQGSKGRAVSIEQREHSSRVMKGRKRSPEAREKSAQFHRGRKRTPEQRERMSVARMGMKFSPEHCLNIALARKGTKAPPEAVEKRRLKAFGRPCSAEHREKIRATLKGRKRPPEVVAKMLATRARTFAARRMEAAHG